MKQIFMVAIIMGSVCVVEAEQAFAQSVGIARGRRVFARQADRGVNRQMPIAARRRRTDQITRQVSPMPAESITSRVQLWRNNYHDANHRSAVTRESISNFDEFIALSRGGTRNGHNARSRWDALERNIANSVNELNRAGGNQRIYANQVEELRNLHSLVTYVKQPNALAQSTTRQHTWLDNVGVPRLTRDAATRPVGSSFPKLIAGSTNRAD